MANYNLIHDFIMEHHLAKEEDFIIKKMSIRFLYLPQIARWEIRRKYLQTFPEINVSLFFSRLVSFRSKVTHLFVILGLYPIARTIFFFQKAMA